MQKPEQTNPQDPLSPTTEDTTKGILSSENLQKVGSPSQKGLILARVFLAISILLNLISLYYHFITDPVLPTEPAAYAIITWTVSVIIAAFAAWFFTHPGDLNKVNIQSIFQQRISSIFYKCYRKIARFFLSWNLWHIGTILVFAFVIRFIPITQNGLFNDEWYWVDQARLILRKVTYSPFGYIGDQPSNLPAFIVLALLKLVGNSLIAVRLPGILYSVVEIAAVYGIITHLFNRQIGKVMALLMSLCVWDIHMSIFGWNNVTIAPFLVTCNLFLLFRIWTNRATILTWFLLACTLAVSIHMLYISTLMVIPVGIALLYYWLHERTPHKTREIILFGILFFICVSPAIPKIAKNPLFALGRHKEFLDLSVAEASNSSSPIFFYLGQVGAILKDLFINAGTFDVPLLWGITLEPVIVALFIFGLGMLLYDLIKRRAHSFWWIVLGTLLIILIIPQVVLFRFSSVWRSYSAWPVLYLVVAYGIHALLQLISREFSQELNKKINVPKFSTFGLVAIYLLVSFPWFKNFFPAYTTPVVDYSTGICQPVNDTIQKSIPPGATIYIPDEPCYLLISAQFEDDLYHFVAITPDFDGTQVKSGDFVVILNSYRSSDRFFREDLQNIANQIITEHPSEVITYNTNARPDIYFIQ